MFWNDPNLYNVAFRDLPYRDLPTLPPVYGAIPRFFQGYTPFTGYNPYPMNPTYFTPPVTPYGAFPGFPPQLNTPQFNMPQFNTPYLPKEMVNPFVNPAINPMTHPYYTNNWGLPFYNTFRTCGL